MEWLYLSATCVFYRSVVVFEHCVCKWQCSLLLDFDEFIYLFIDMGLLKIMWK